MQRLVILLFLVFYGCLHAQTLPGKVVSAENNAPISGASVFLSNTSSGTVSKNDGSFEITAFPNGKFDLIVSCIGFETYALPVQSGLLPAFLTISLKPKAKELQEVVLTPYIKNGWQIWGQLFVENFIGATPYAANCVLKNKDVLKFRHHKKTNKLQVTANAPLVLENKALGYTIEYQLENFEYNFDTDLIFYYGYALFKLMDVKSDKQRKKWETNREEVYYGSILHFMRSLYRNKLSEDGFDVRRLYKKPNIEKQRIRAIIQRSDYIRQPQSVRSKLQFDSTAYYDNILSQTDEISYLVKTVLPGDSIAYGVDSSTAGVEFNDYLDITYTKKKEPLSYLAYLRSKRPPSFPVSQVTLLNNKHIEVLSNGSFFNPTDMVTSGYWSWSEKVSSMLPFDYNPGIKK